MDKTSKFYGAKRITRICGIVVTLLIAFILPSYATPTPSNFNEVAGDQQVALSWDAVPDAIYVVYYRYSSIYAWSTDGFLTDTTDVITGLTNDHQYEFAVRAYWNNGGYSLFTSSLYATPLAPPTNLTASYGNSKVNLSWTKGTGASETQILRSTTSGGPYTLVQSSTSTSWSDTSVSNGTNYYYVANSINYSGSAGYSNEVSAMPRDVPGTPENFVATPGSTQIFLTWDTVPYATSYKIQRATQSNGSYSNIGTSATNSYTNTGCTNGITYYYRVAAVNDVGTSAWTYIVSATPQLSAPANLTAVSTAGKVTLTWEAVAGADNYEVFRSTVHDGPYTLVKTTNSSTTSWADTAVTNGTTYYYVVIVIDNGVESPNSNEAIGTPWVALAAPVNFTAVAGNQQIELNWDAVTGATEYRVYRKPSGGSYSVVATVTDTHYTDTGLTDGTTYYYKVAAANINGQETLSAEINAKPRVTPPINVIATPGASQVVLTWDAVPGATGYKIRNGTTSGSYGSSKSSSTNSYTWTGLSNGTTYYFVVTATDSAGESGYSSEVSAAPFAAPSAPTSLVAVAGNSQVALTWNIVSGVDGYQLQRKPNGGAYSVLAAPASNSYTDTDVVNGTKYYYKVFATKGIAVSSASNEVNATPRVGAPTNLVAVASSGQVTLTWDAVPLALGYKVKRGTSSGSYNTSVAVSTNSYTWTGLSNGTTYYFVVNATDAAGDGAISNQAVATPQVGTVQNLVAVPGNAKVLLSWDAVGGATKYSVKRSTTVGGPYTQIATPTATNYSDTSAVNGTTYYYVVAAVSGSIEGALSNEASATPSAPLAAPLNLTAIASNQRVNLSWDAVSGASQYKIYRKAGSGSYLVIATITDIAYEDTGLTDGTTYSYKVSALDSFQNEGTSSVIVTAQPRVTVPVNIVATPGNKQVTVTWDAVPGATSYRIRGSATSGSYGSAKSSSTNSYTWTGLTNGTLYYFVVTAVDSAGESAYSIEVSATPNAIPAAPTGLAATGGDAQVSLTWNVVSGATTYAVKRATVAGGPYTVITNQVATASYQDSDVVNGTTYYYVVSALSGSAESGNSNQASATPLPPAPAAPGAPTFSNLTSTSVDVTAPELPENADSLLLQAKVAGADDNTYTTVENNIEGEDTITADWLQGGITYTFRYIAVGLGGQTPGGIANVVIPNRDISWNPTNPISCAGIYYPTGATATIAAGTVGRFSAYLATAWDVRTVTVDGVSTTALYSQPCSYTWSADGGDPQDGINTGQSFVWIAPSTPGTYTITLDVADQNDGNKGNGESGTRHRSALSFSITVTVQ